MKTSSSHPDRRASLATLLGLFLILGAAVIIIPVFSYNFTASRRTVRDGVERNTQQLAAATVNRIVAALAPVERIPRLAARTLEERNVSEAELLDLLRNTVELNPEVYGSTAAFEPDAFKPGTPYFCPYYCRAAPGKPLKFQWCGGPDYQYFFYDWYQIPRELDAPTWSEPFCDKGAGNVVMTTYSVPFHRPGKTGAAAGIGVITADIELAWLCDMVAKTRVLDTGYAFLLSRNGVFLTHPDQRRIMNESIFDLAEEQNSPELRRIGRDMIRGRQGTVDVRGLLGGNRPCRLAYAPVPLTGWSLGLVLPEPELYAQLDALNRRLLLIAAAGFVALFLLVLLLSRFLTRPLQRISTLAEHIASGNLERAVADLPVFEAQAAKLQAREYRTLSGAFAAMVRSLHSLIAQVRHSGIQVQSVSTEISASARQLEATVAEQAAATQQVSATSRQISTRSRDLAAAMGDVTALASANAGRARKCQGALGEMEADVRQLMAGTGQISARLDAIHANTANIGGIVGAITKVADQTNLLSLNAAIEAEKAGRHGLGFAVVAREIRRLADQTASATLDIEAMVTAMRGAVGDGVTDVNTFVDQVRRNGERVHDMGVELAGMVEEVMALFPRFEAVTQAMREQASGADEITQSVTQLSQGADHTREALGEFNQATAQLTAAVQALQQEVAQFKVKN